MGCTSKIPRGTRNATCILIDLLANQAFNGNRTIADLRYGGKDIISPSTIIFPSIKGLLGMYSLHIPPEVL